MSKKKKQFSNNNNEIKNNIHKLAANSVFVVAAHSYYLQPQQNLW